MSEEYQSMMVNKAWTLVNKPKDRKIVKCTWVFQQKNDVDDKVRFKARLVAKGFTQKYGEDYNETFAPIVRHSTIRLLLALSVNLNLNVDVTTAFLNSELEEEIYMDQPEGLSI